LLRAVLLPGPDALAHWHQWKRNTATDPASNRLLPLLYHNLHRLGVEARDLQPYRNAYERSWCENQFMFSQAAALVRELQSKEIPSVLLKGIALALAFYPDPALRPMADIDVLVRPGQIAAASAVCRRLGWQPVFDPQDLLPLDQGVHFTRNSAFQLDLHWRVFWQFHKGSPDEKLWHETLPLTVAGAHARCLNATMQLLHVCVHGTQWCEEPTIRWVADAMAILRSDRDAVNWDNLLDQAVRRKYTLALLDTLTYLHQALAAPVPPEVLQSLRRIPATMFDRISYRALASGNEALRTLLWWQVVAPLRDGSKIPWRKRTSMLLRYVAAKWRVRSPWNLPFSAVAKLGRKAARGFVAALSAKPARPAPSGLDHP